MNPRPPSLEPESQAVFLDFDGVLAELRHDPLAVGLPPGGAERLTRLMAACAGALAVVTGRDLATLDRLIAPLRPAAGGLHGLEMRAVSGGDIERGEPPAAIGIARERLPALLRAAPELRLEDKGGALVLHFRGSPHLDGTAREIAERAVDGLDGVMVVPGHMIHEIRAAGVDKGEIVERFMAHAPFKGRQPVFIGDDRTDEDGFAAAQNLGGFGIKVGEGVTVARYRLADVSAVHAWLEEAVVKSHIQ